MASHPAQQGGGQGALEAVAARAPGADGCHFLACLQGVVRAGWSGASPGQAQYGTEPAWWQVSEEPGHGDGGVGGEPGAEPGASSVGVQDLAHESITSFSFTRRATSALTSAVARSGVTGRVAASRSAPCSGVAPSTSACTTRAPVPFSCQ